MYWEEEEEEWHLKNAIRVDEKVRNEVTKKELKFTFYQWCLFILTGNTKILLSFFQTYHPSCYEDYKNVSVCSLCLI